MLTFFRKVLVVPIERFPDVQPGGQRLGLTFARLSESLHVPDRAFITHIVIIFYYERSKKNEKEKHFNT